MSDTITFATIPASNRIPGVWFEVDASGANTITLVQRALIVGQMLSTGSAPANTPILATSITDARGEFGVGSMLVAQLQAFRANNPTMEVWILPLADDPAGVAASGTVQVIGPATASGTIDLYVAGNDVQVAVASGDTATTIATNLNAAINAYKDLPVTSTVTTDTVTVTSNHKGLAAADISLVPNYYGKRNGEVLPTGVSLTITQPTGGAADPAVATMQTALAALGDVAYDYIIWPYTTAQALNTIQEFMNDDSGRWSWSIALFGGAWSAYKDTVSNLQSFGVTRNDQHMNILGVDISSPTPAYVWGAAFTGVTSQSLAADPALPLQNVAVYGVLPPTDRWTFDERETMLWSGISTFKVNDSGAVILERTVTTYQQDALGMPDNSYLDSETPYTLQFLILDLKADLSSKFARKKLVDDNARIIYGSNYVTAASVKNEVIANYNINAARGLCQNPDVFASNVVAENQGNGVVAVVWPGQLAQQLRQILVKVAFSKP